MSVLDQLKMYSRFGFGLRRYLRRTITLEQAQTAIKRRNDLREHNFIRLLEKGVFNNPRSPYLPLMKLADCEMGDIRDMVRTRGLEYTLLALRKAGVYVSFEEFRGRKAIKRNGKVFPVKAHDFDNPFTTRYYETETGGSTGAGRRISQDLEYRAEQASPLMVARHAHGVLNVPTALWRGPLPDGSGLNQLLCAIRYGNVPRKWFTAHLSSDSKPSMKSRIATYTTVIVGRLSEIPIPWPEAIKLDQAIALAHWAVQMVELHGSCLIIAPVSRALRVCLAAADEGLDLTGTAFMVGGEPQTDAKVRQIEAAGARQFPTYAIAEVSHIGLGCTKPVDCNDLHLMRDFFSIIPFPRTVAGPDITVSAFNFTTLLPSTPILMLNVETDDYGIIEKIHCGCPLESLGYTEHLRNILSFSKLTVEGVTLLGSKMIRILEETLPARFGGSPLDYQLMEEEDENGFTRLNLLVSPKIRGVDDRDMIDTILNSLTEGSNANPYARSILREGGSLRVRRMDPIWTSRGKLMPLHLERRSPRPYGSSMGKNER